MSTIDAVRDMDLIREALGADQINYYGFSYGTYLGQVYATLFPGRMRRAVFDGERGSPQRLVPGQPQSRPRLRPEHPDLVRVARGASRRLSPREDPSGRRSDSVLRGVNKRMVAEPAGGVVGPSEWDDVVPLRRVLRVPMDLPRRRLLQLGPPRQREEADRVRTDTPTVPASTTASPSTTPSSAPTSSGRPTGRPGRGQLGDLRAGAVLHVGERLVQRTLSLLARAGRRPHDGRGR